MAELPWDGAVVGTLGVLLMSIFGGQPGPDAFELLHESMNHQFENLQDTLNVVNKNVTRIGKVMQENFNKVHATMEEIQFGIDGLRRHVSIAFLDENLAQVRKRVAQIRLSIDRFEMSRHSDVSRTDLENFETDLLDLYSNWIFSSPIV